ncbi:hypothetical protein SAMN05660420_03315 [Desulfuromusa kysingii]|uniref:Uncharacterized protein n=1 Tax=Desulfuromusa kysingii TaxID=37625 RepID=A0A1H4EE28_9BACT|nr:hypothetical protein [Desulfuromusa kysingii]SEA82532.1 hypothetical protein SAMN05660420_03315 [Desulfuromusa kysingii]
MTEQETLQKLIAKRLTRILYVAETALPQNQYQAFRKIALDEFGNNGLNKDLEQIWKTKKRNGQE